MLLTGNTFDTISALLRKDGGDARQRQLQLQVDVTLATASGDVIDARIHHFARGGVGLSTTTPLHPGNRFGFKVPENEGTHFLFCEVLTCRVVKQGFVVAASFLAQDTPGSHNRLEVVR